METKIINVFYGQDLLPYKDKERQVHYPITSGAFLGASDTTKIRFYFDRIGNSNTTWVAVAKLPNGKQGSKVLSVSVDSELGENYAELSLDNWFTQAKGDVYIALQGYQGGVEYSYDSDTELYEIHGTPTIQTTGSIKLAINYAPIGQVADYNDEFTTYQEILAGLGDKADISSTIIVVNDITQVVATTYEDGQIFYNLADRKLYQLDNSSFVVFQPYVVISSEPIPQSDFDIILAHKEYPIIYGSYVFWYYGEETLALRYARNDLDVSSNTFTTTKQQLIIFKNTREYDLLTQNAETYKKSKIDTELSGKADKSTTYTKTETDDLLNTKQNTLVSGTNIKSLTVDGVEKSLLGSGTIEVGSSSGGGAWGEITGDIQDQTDLQNELTNIREVAEGKNKTFVIRYSIEAPTTDSSARMFKKIDGTTFTNLADFNSYVSGLSIANASFNTQGDIALTNYYIIGDDFIVYRDNDIHSNFKVGDIILVVQTDVPDRWFSFIYSTGALLSKLETTKVDLTNYATKTEVAQKSDLSNIAPLYDSDTTYAVGDKTIHDGKLYTCNTPITTPESWNSEHWTQVSVASGFVDLDKEQVISGVKTFEKINFVATAGTPQINGNNGHVNISLYNSNRYVFDTTDFYPTSARNLGTSSLPWGDLYLSGNINFATTKIYEDSNNRLAFYENGEIKWLILTDGTLRPYNTNQNSIGLATSRVRNLYLSNVVDFTDSNTKILNHAKNTTYGLTLPDTTNFTANQEIATGVKEISAPSSITLNDDEYATFTSGSIIKINGTFLGLTNPVLVLGGNNANFYWGTAIGSSGTLENTFATYYIIVASKQIFLAGNSDRYEVLKSIKSINGTNFDDIKNGTFNVINASDITSNTLTQAQYDLITNGKPTLIIGNAQNVVNGVWYYCGNFPTNAVFRVMGQSSQTGYFAEKSIVCNLTTKVLSAPSDKLVNVDNLQMVNGKIIPNYPSSTGTFNFQMVNGIMAWNQQWYGTQAEYDALGTYDSNTTYNILES